MKRGTMVSIDIELINEIKQRDINLSELLNTFLRQHLYNLRVQNQEINPIDKIKEYEAQQAKITQEQEKISEQLLSAKTMNAEKKAHEKEKLEKKLISSINSLRATKETGDLESFEKQLILSSVKLTKAGLKITADELRAKV